MDKWVKKSEKPGDAVKNTLKPVLLLKHTNINHAAELCEICGMLSHLKLGWLELLRKEIEKEYFRSISAFLHSTTFYPSPKDVLRALSYFDVEETKVVILGQDPYHGPGQAMGLAFSVPRGIGIPPSLRNIYKEIHETIGFPKGIPGHGSLEGWARQGVLLLNTTLTVSPSSPGSHHGVGWHIFTDAIISAVSDMPHSVVFLLWGADAKKKDSLIDKKKHLVLSSAHPSPLSASRGFFGCDHFRKANAFLQERKRTPIDWTRID